MSASVTETVAQGFALACKTSDPDAGFDSIADDLSNHLSALSEEDRKAAAETHKTLGNDKFKASEFHASVYYYSVALAADPANAVLFSNRAAAHLKLEAYGSALSDAEAAIRCDEGFIKAHYRRGAAHMAMGKFGDAVNDFRLVLKLKPGDAEAKRRLAMCKKAEYERAFALAIATEQTKQPSETIDLDAMPIPADYDGPVIDYTVPIEKRYPAATVEAIMEWFREQKAKSLPRRFVYGIIRDIISLLSKLPSLVDVPIPEGSHITVCGDTHGQYYDVLKIFRLNGLPSVENPYLFNGDFVDRGSWSLEVALTLFLWKLSLPNHVHLTRGNHESTNMNITYGFKGEVLAKADEKTFDLFTEAFNWLPIAYCLGKKVLVLHGGLFNAPNVTLNDIRKVQRFRQPPESGIMCDALWSDPSARSGRNPPQRGCGVMFGPDVTQKFCEDNGLKYVVRSHEMKMPGYSVDHGGRCITVFSAPNYCDQAKNQGAFLIFDDNCEYKVVQFAAAPHPNVRAMAYANPMMMM